MNRQSRFSRKQSFKSRNTHNKIQYNKNKKYIYFIFIKLDFSKFLLREITLRANRIQIIS